jgi:large subunit ribosomal protein L25
MSQKVTSLTATTRTEVGHNVKLVRRQGMLPAVIYGSKTEVKYLQLVANDVKKFMNQHTPQSTFELAIDGKKLNVKIQAIDFHPVKETIRHMDFIIM